MLLRSPSFPSIGPGLPSIALPKPPVRAARIQFLQISPKSFYSSDPYTMPRRQTKEQVFKSTMRGVDFSKKPETSRLATSVKKGLGRKLKMEEKEMAVAHPSAR